MKKGIQSIVFNNVYINETATVVGPVEGRGPLKTYFDKVYHDLRLDQESFEKAEIMFQKDAIKILLQKSLEIEANIDYVMAGDLINQDAISNYALRDYSIPFIGIFGACSTSVLGVINGANYIEAQSAKKVITMTSSHNLSAERQFRNPVEYGGAKNDTTTFTVSGASACLLSDKEDKIKVTGATIGKVIDVGFKDATDMGRAMAPAAIETLITHFNDFNTNPSDYDLILTGDLSLYGSEIVRKMLNERYQSVSNYNDCGNLIFNRQKDEVFAGGSGCACCGVVSFGYIKKLLLDGRYKKVLICATGALLNTNLSLQKESIPCIAHAIVLEVV